MLQASELQHPTAFRHQRLFRWLAIAFALLALSHPVVQLYADLGAYVDPAAVGASINAASGAVDSVTPRSKAAAAGLQAGDRVDFARGGRSLHYWLWDGRFPTGKPVALPMIRGSQKFVATILAEPAPLNAGEIAYDVTAVIVAVVLMTLACAAVFAGANVLSLAFFGFCVTFAADPNTAWVYVSPPSATALAWVESSLSVAAGAAGFLYLCLRFPTGSAIGVWRYVDRMVVPFALLSGTMYIAHFFSAALITGQTEALYRLLGTFTIVSYLVGIAAYVARFRGARGPEVTRMRWVAAAIAVFIGIRAIFFIDQSLGHDTLWVNWLVLLNPAPYAFAYALVQRQVVDIRIVGGRALIYAVITSIPVALLAFADWFFARRLENARLATVFEVAIALGFSFWLRTLHRRIDRFAERVFFATRHQAFQRIHQVTEALPFTERVETIEALLTEETAHAMRFSSAAVFRSENGAYIRTAAKGWHAWSATTLDADDPIVLFARSAHHGVRLNKVPHSKAALPTGSEAPVFALPVVVGRRIIAVVLYGGHRDGEAIDAEEEQLLTGLAHAAATAYEHLNAVERERENSALRAQIAALTTNLA